MPASLHIGIYLPNEREGFLLDRFPLGPQDQLGPIAPVGEGHKQITIHRESTGLTEEQADLLLFIKEEFGAMVNILPVKSLRSRR